MTAPMNPNLAANLPPRGPSRVVYLEADRAPTILDTKYRDGSYYLNNTEWRDNSTTPPGIWKLAKINSKTNATWFLIGGAPSGTVITLSDTAGTKTGPDGTGNIQLKSSDASISIVTNALNNLIDFTLSPASTIEILVDGSSGSGTNPVLPNGTGQFTLIGGVPTNTGLQNNPIQVISTAANTMSLQIQLAGNNATPGVSNKFGVAQFDSAQFDVTGGFVNLKGSTGPAATKFQVDAFTGPGTNPVVPDNTGKVTVTGALTLAGAVPVRTDSLSVNSYRIEVQTSQALAAADSTKVGLSNFDSLAFTVSSTGFVQSLGAAAGGWVNLGCSISGGTFTIHGQDGSALSAANPAYIYIRKASSLGDYARYTITANQSFRDINSGASDIAGNLFGLGSGTTAGVINIPFYLYAAINTAQDTVAFGLSRYPHYPFVTATANIGTIGSAIADNEPDWWMWTGTHTAITPANYAGNPALLIGAINMQKTSATDDWAIQAMTTKSGIGQYLVGVYTSMYFNQYGAAASAFAIPNGGTTPSGGADYRHRYTVRLDGTVHFEFSTSPKPNPGAGAVTAQMGIPLKPRWDEMILGTAIFRASNHAGNNTAYIPYSLPLSGGVVPNIIQWFLGTGTATTFQWATFTANGDLQTIIDYLITEVS